MGILGLIVALVGIQNPRGRVHCADCQPPAVSTTGDVYVSIIPFSTS